MKNILSYQEYQNRIKNVMSPEEAAALTQELLAPTIAELSRPAPREQQENDAPDATIRATHASNARKPWTAQNPWSDVIGNETEAMVMSLYAKGMTTREPETRACKIKTGPQMVPTYKLSLGNICEPADSEFTIHTCLAGQGLFTCAFIIPYSQKSTMKMNTMKTYLMFGRITVASLS